MIRNKNIRIGGLLIFFLLSIGLLGASGDQEERESKPQTVQVTGRVRLVGSSPQNVLVITGEKREWLIDKNDEKKLWDLQQQTVTVKGRETSREMHFANGKSAGVRYYLSKIKIVEPGPAGVGGTAP
jgi:hypothetical protein